jgi:Ca2+-binding EF-hand superfamily protein
MSTSSPTQNSTPTTAKELLGAGELRDLRRVFDHLANYVPRKSLNGVLAERSDKLSKLKDFMDNPATGQPVIGDNGVEIGKYQAPEEYRKLNEEISDLKQSEKKLTNDANKKITIRDLDAALRSLGRNCSKKELEYMIWEVDENLDLCVDWEEFQLMFYRNTTDQTGLEPFELFNIVQFMTYDEDFKGHITEDDTMSTLFARHGRENLEAQMTKLFGDQLKSAGGEGILTLEQYLKAVSARCVKSKDIDYTITTSVAKRSFKAGKTM